MQAVDSIILKGLEFMACHGVLPQEKSEPQPFLVDAQLYLDLRAAAASDDLDRGVDYSQVYRSIEAVVQGSTFNLIETLAENIARRILEEYPVEAAAITVKKPQAPMPGPFQYAGVHIFRERS